MVRSPSHPVISVVLPVRNAAESLSAAVRSIQHQSYPQWELLVVDDGSTDGSRELAIAAADEDGRVRVLTPSTPGLVPALEHGLAEAKGNFIARMDADDVSDPRRLAVQLDFLDRHPELGLVGCQVGLGASRQGREGYAAHVDWLNQLRTPQQIRLNRFIESPHAHPSVLFRRELVRQHGGYQAGPFPEDYELWLRWLEAGVEMAKVPETLLTWNDAPARLSRTDPRYSPAAFFAVKAPYLAAAIRRTLNHRQLWIWGAGRLTRRRAERLLACGLSVAGYIDIDPRKARRSPGGLPVRLPADLPSPAHALIVVYVANRGARELIRPQLQRHGYTEGTDFWVAA